MVSTVFDYISDTPDHIEFTVKVSMIEIYMERIRDLLNPKKVNLKIREDKSKGIYIEDVTESYVSDERDVYDFLKYGQNNRTTTTTNMNETSSRSHCLFMMTIHQNNLLEMHAKTGKLCLVDLAGSEKVAKTGAVGQVLEEAKEINKSLSALGNVINALTDSRGLMHIPYRDSKLTRILQESLGGNARTSLIINCSPSSYNENETISALRFGYRAKSIKNTPKINREYTAAQLQVLLEKAEKKIVIKDKRIKVLEEILYEHEIEIPGEVALTEIHPSPNKRNTSYCKKLAIE
jgi:kinesin family protein 5